MQTYGDMGEVKVLKQISLMWEVPESVYMKDAHGVVSQREKAQAIQVMLHGWALSSRLLLWERWRKQIEKFIVQWEHPQRFTVHPAVNTGRQLHICTKVSGKHSAHAPRCPV
jgi:hypothetical protein